MGNEGGVESKWEEDRESRRILRGDNMRQRWYE